MPYQGNALGALNEPSEAEAVTRRALRVLHAEERGDGTAGAVDGSGVARGDFAARKQALVPPPQLVPLYEAHVR
jgi:hypothetical protein